MRVVRGSRDWRKNLVLFWVLFFFLDLALNPVTSRTCYKRAYSDYVDPINIGLCQFQFGPIGALPFWKCVYGPRDQTTSGGEFLAWKESRERKSENRFLRNNFFESYTRMSCLDLDLTSTWKCSLLSWSWYIGYEKVLRQQSLTWIRSFECKFGATFQYD
jgi:hypothetical protein